MNKETENKLKEKIKNLLETKSFLKNDEIIEIIMKEDTYSGLKKEYLLNLIKEVRDEIGIPEPKPKPIKRYSKK